MRTSSFLLVVSVTLAMVSGALAGEQAKATKPADNATSAKASEATKSAATEKPTFVTGSYLKQNVRRDGQIAEGPNHVLIIDSESIRASGGSSILEVLNRRGTLH